MEATKGKDRAYCLSKLISKGEICKHQVGSHRQLKNPGEHNEIPRSSKSTRVLAGGAVALLLCFPASALDLGKGLGGLGLGGTGVGAGKGGIHAGVGVSVGGANGVNAGVGANVGGKSGINAGLGASVGGRNGVTAGLGANVGGKGGISAGLGASVGGKGGINAGVGANVGNGIGLGIGVSIGGNGGGGGGGGGGGKTGGDDPTVTPSKPGLADGGRSNSTRVAGLSSKEVARYKRRCVDVLSNSSGYDSDLVSLCAAIRRM